MACRAQNQKQEITLTHQIRIMITCATPRQSLENTLDSIFGKTSQTLQRTLTQPHGQIALPRQGLPTRMAYHPRRLDLGPILARATT